MKRSGLVPYHFAVLRVVPHVHLGVFANVGVVVHAPTAEFLRMRVVTEPEKLRLLAPGVDTDLLSRYLQCCQRICDGDTAAGPLALAAPSERFHWLTSPRSDVLQSSPVHEGLASDLAGAVEELFAGYVQAQF